MLKENNILWSIGQLAMMDLSSFTDGLVELEGKSGTYINEIASLAQNRIQSLELTMLDFIETETDASDRVEMFLNIFLQS